MSISGETTARTGPDARGSEAQGEVSFKHSRLPWRLAVAMALPLFTSAACGGFCKGYTDNSLQGAKFSAEEPGVTLSIDREAKAVTLVEGDRIIERAFTVVPESDRPLRCPTQGGATRVEVLDLGDAPLALGGKTFERPVLEAACGKRRQALLADWDDEGTLKAELIFEPAE